jgi:hypothetical protein
VSLARSPDETRLLAGAIPDRGNADSAKQQCVHS